MSSFQQKALTEGREEFELELRDLLSKDLPTDRDGFPKSSELRKADTLVQAILDLFDRCAGR